MATKRKPAPKTAPAKKVKAGTGKEAAADRKARFVEAYIANGGNASKAALAAGYSPATAGQQGSRLLKDVEIAQAVAARSKKVADRYELSTEMVVKSIVQEITFDPARLYGADGQLLSIPDLPEDVRMALASVEFEQHGSPEAPVFVRKVKWAARQGAREQAMKHLGMFEADNKQRLLEGVSRDVLKEVAERLRG
jgi:phage terminase small subunit